MAYRTILVHVDDTRHMQRCIEVAARIARAEQAHLIGAAGTSIHTPLYPTGLADPTLPTLNARAEQAQQRLERVLSVFDAAMGRIGVASFETRLIEGDAVEAISVLARHCDLVVLGQTDPDAPAPLLPADFPEDVILRCGRPVLVVPRAGQFDTVGRKPLVAWDSSMSAARSVANAIPLLQRAEQIDLVMFSPGAKDGAHAKQSRTDMALYLARHGINIKAEHRRAAVQVGPALLSLSSELGSDVIVMGAYGHHRLRDILLGSVTQSILQSTTVPALMSH